MKTAPASFLSLYEVIRPTFQHDKADRLCVLMMGACPREWGELHAKLGDLLELHRRDVFKAWFGEEVGDDQKMSDTWFGQHRLAQKAYSRGLIDREIDWIMEPLPDKVA